MSVTTVVHGIILGIDMPFPISNPDACLDSGVSCPLKKGNVYEYTATFPILKAYPKVRDFGCVCSKIFNYFFLWFLGQSWC